MASLFISDLHLDPQRPASTALFRRFLSEFTQGAQALYILGDLLEYWLGDDDDPGTLQPSLEQLAALADAGCALYLMHGNRDFLIGSEFARRCGARLVEDPMRIELDGVATLLTHGDTLCTDDVPYQRFRAQVRAPDWRSNFLAQPLAERRRQAQQLRERSRAAVSHKPAQIMDVNAGAVLEAMGRHAVRRLIHGHTHRPGVHRLPLAQGEGQRLVLGDWYHHGSYLRCAEGRCQLMAFAQEGPPRLLGEA